MNLLLVQGIDFRVIKGSAVKGIFFLCKGMVFLCNLQTLFFHQPENPEGLKTANYVRFSGLMIWDRTNSLCDKALIDS